jgi:hypothetical protein
MSIGHPHPSPLYIGIAMLTNTTLFLGGTGVIPHRFSSLLKARAFLVITDMAAPESWHTLILMAKHEQFL